jgi:RNA polymerase sigma factor for flagellar operon FliA
VKNVPASTPTTEAEPARKARRRDRKSATSRSELRPLPGGDELFITHPDVLLSMLGEESGFDVPHGEEATEDIAVDDHVRLDVASEDESETALAYQHEDDVEESDDTTEPEVAGDADVAHRATTDVAALCRQHLAFADTLAHAVHRRIDDRVPVAMLVSAARYGLWDAARRFDPARGVRFRIYAQRRIVGAIFDDLRTESVIPHQKTRSPELSAVLGACSLATRVLAGADDIAWLTSWCSTIGLRAVPVARGVSLAGVVAADESLADEQLAHEDLLVALRTAVKELEPREQAIVYGIYEHERTLDDVSGSLELSKSWGSRLHGEIVVRLKRAMLRAGYRELFASDALPPLVAYVA